MKGMQRQKGLTTITMALMVALIAFLALIAIRLFPIYVEHYKVSSHLGDLSKVKGVAGFSDNQIRETLGKRFDIDDVEHVKPENIFIERPDHNTTVIAIEYEVRTPAFGNVDMVASFVDEVEVRP